jgi:hypothetical protein
MAEVKEVKFETYPVTYKEYLFSKLGNLVFIYSPNIILYVFGIIKEIDLLLAIPFCVWIIGHTIFYILFSKLRTKEVVII